MPGRTISVVVLSFDRPHLLSAALQSVLDQSLRPNEIIVVDNPSTTSTDVRRIVLGIPGVCLVQPPRNLGFAGGMNLGLAQASGEIVVLTEDDIVLDPTCLAGLVGCLERRPDAGIVGPVIYNRGDGTIRCAGGAVRLGPVFRHETYERLAGDSDAPIAVGYLPGAILAARTAELRQLGGFRSEFFMYSEDTDLCFRLARAGRSLLLEPRARCRHFEPAAGAESGELAYHKYKNFVLLYLLHAPLPVLPVFFVRYGLLALARAWRAPARRRVVWRGWRWAIARLPHVAAERLGWSRPAPITAQTAAQSFESPA